MRFTPEQVRALCGGRFPNCGFDWNSVGYFRWEGGVLQPYAGDEILPGPSITVSVCTGPNVIELSGPSIVGLVNNLGAPAPEEDW
jgi:hypothetical protein